MERQTPNPELKLLPGMTANLSFQIKKREGILRVPNAALRFYPPRDKVHPDDRKILDNVDEQKQVVTDTAKQMSADEKAAATRAQNLRHVWIAEGNFLRGKPVRTGISDNRYTELIEGDLSAEEDLVVGEKPKQ